MAYKINRHDEYVIAPDGIATVKDVSRLRSELMQLSPEFYELEPAEIIEIYLDEEDLPLIGETDKPDWSKYGWVLARMAISSKNEKDYVELKPLDTNIKEYPLPGEFVIAVDYFGLKYYTQKINYSNSVNSNSYPGLTRWTTSIQKEFKIVDFKENSKIRQLQAEEGDIIFNGRFGQSIRFGSNITEKIKDDNTIDSDTGKENSPNIIIRTGQSDPKWDLDKFVNRPVLEDINNDNSSIWMTTNQTVPFKPSSVSKIKNQFVKKFDGNQIILNSDRMIFNSRLDNTYIFSNKIVDISANEEIVLQIPEKGAVKLGDAEAVQPVLGGDQTMKLFDKLLGVISEFCIQISGAVGGGNIGIPVPLTQINVAAVQLNSSILALKLRLDEPKSKTVTVAHIRGPQ